MTSSGQDWQLADLLADLPPPKCIMGYILWNVFGSNNWILQERVGISFYF